MSHNPPCAGLINNEPGQQMASSFVYYKDRTKRKPVGLLVGKGSPTDRKAYGQDVYMAHYAVDGIWPSPPTSKRRSSTEQTMQDRLGFHTFRRGDFVEYLEPLQAGEQPVDVVVFGVCCFEATESGASRIDSKPLPSCRAHQWNPMPSNPTADALVCCCGSCRGWKGAAGPQVARAV